MKTIKLLFAACAAVLMTGVAKAGSNVAKVVLENDAKTLRFVYDDEDYGTKGTDWFSASEAEASKYTPPWCEYEFRTTVTNVVIDASFKDYRPGSCREWLCGFWRVKEITGLENLDTSAATDMYGMFESMRIKELDLSSFDTSNVTNMNRMFYQCGDLVTIYATELFTTDRVADDADTMFSFCSELVGGMGMKYDVYATDKEYAKIDAGGGRWSSTSGYFTLPPAKAVLEDGGATLRFACDNADHGTKGADWFSVEEAEADPGEYPPWHVRCADVTQVVLAPTFKSYRLKRCDRWLADFANLTAVKGLTNINTSAATSMERMFYGCTALASLDLFSFDTSSVTNMHAMFGNCSALTTIHASYGFVTKGVVDDGDMFKSCTSLTGGFGTAFDATRIGTAYASIDAPAAPGYFTGPIAKVVFEDGGKTLRFVCDETDYGTKDTDWFSVSEAEAGGLMSQTPWRRYSTAAQREAVTKAVVDASFRQYRPKHCCYWFDGLVNATAVEGLKNLDTSAATSLSDMFYGCASLTSLDLTSFDTSNVTNMNRMFCKCYALKRIHATDKFTMEGVTADGNMFSDCTSLKGAYGTAYDPNHTDGTYARIDASVAPGYLSRVAKIVIRYWHSARADMYFVYDDEDYGTKGKDWFSIDEAIDAGPYQIPAWHQDVIRTNVTSVYFRDGFGEFRPEHCGCWFYGFERLDYVGGTKKLDLSRATHLTRMFSGCSALETLDLSPVVATNLTDLYGMFDSCDSLQGLDLSGFDTSNVTEMRDLFKDCAALQAITASTDFVTTALSQPAKGVFTGCTSLKGGWGTAYDPNHTDSEYARVDLPAVPGYLTLAHKVAKDPIFAINGAGVGAGAAAGDGWLWDGKVVHLTKGGGQYLVTGGTPDAPVDVAFSPEANAIGLSLSNFCAQVDGSVIALTSGTFTLKSVWGANVLCANGAADPVIDVPSGTTLKVVTCRGGNLELKAGDASPAQAEVAVGKMSSSSCGTIVFDGDGLFEISGGVGVQASYTPDAGSLTVKGGINCTRSVGVSQAAIDDGCLLVYGAVTAADGFRIDGGVFCSSAVGSQPVNGDAKTLWPIKLPGSSIASTAASGAPCWDPVHVSGLPANYGQNRLFTYDSWTMGPSMIWLPLRNVGYVLTAGDAAYGYTSADMQSGASISGASSVREKGSATGVKVNGTAVAYGGAGAGWRMVDGDIELDGSAAPYVLTTDGKAVTGVGVKALASTEMTLDDFHVRHCGSPVIDLGETATNRVTFVGTNTVLSADVPGLRAAQDLTCLTGGVNRLSIGLYGRSCELALSGIWAWTPQFGEGAGPVLSCFHGGSPYVETARLTANGDVHLFANGRSACRVFPNRNLIVDVKRHSSLTVRDWFGLHLGIELVEAGGGNPSEVRFVGEGCTYLRDGIGGGTDGHGQVSVENGFLVNVGQVGMGQTSPSREGWLGTLKVSGGTMRVGSYVHANSVTVTGGSILCDDYHGTTPYATSPDVFPLEPLHRVTVTNLVAEYEEGHENDDNKLPYQKPISVFGLPDGYGTEGIYSVDGKVCFLLPDGDYKFMLDQRVFTATVNGADVTATEIPLWTYEKDGDYVTITGCALKPPHVVVPAELGGGRVWKLGDNLFGYWSSQDDKEDQEGCFNIRTVTLPETLEHIGERVFFSCTNLVSVTGLENVRDIGMEAFSNCRSLESLEIPYLNRISSSCFALCEKLTGVELPVTCRSIEDDAFRGCFSLEEIDVPEGVTNVKSMAFYESGLRSVRLPSTILRIGRKAFANAKNLTNVVINAMQAPTVANTYESPFHGVPETAILQVPNGSCGWDGDPESAVLPERWNGLLVQAFVPAFDAPEGAVPVEGEGDEGDASVCNNGAAADPTDPVAEFAADDLASSVWFRWTAPETGRVTFRTETLVDGLDTVMTVSRGAPGALTTIAYNDDEHAETLLSAVTFGCTAGVDYYFCVATKDNAAPWGEIGLAWAFDAVSGTPTGAFVNGISVGDNYGGDGWYFDGEVVRLLLPGAYAVTGGTAQAYAAVGIRVEADARVTFTDTCLYAGENSVVKVLAGCTLDMDVRGTRCVFARTDENNDSQVIEAVAGSTLNLDVSRHTELVTEGYGVSVGGKFEGCGDITITGDGILTLNDSLGISYPDAGLGRIDINGCRIATTYVENDNGDDGYIYLNGGTLTVAAGYYIDLDAHHFYVNGGHVVGGAGIVTDEVYAYDEAGQQEHLLAKVTLTELPVRYEAGHENEAAYQLPLDVKGLPETFGANSLYATPAGNLTLYLPEGTYALTNELKCYSFWTEGAWCSPVTVEEIEPPPEPPVEAANVDAAHAMPLDVTADYGDTNQILKTSVTLWYRLSVKTRGTMNISTTAIDFRDMRLTVYKGTDPSSLVEVPRGTDLDYWAAVKVEADETYYASITSAELCEDGAVGFVWRVEPPTGFEQWAYENGLTGDDAAMDAKPAKWGGQWANAFVYIFGSDIISGKNPLMQISFDANGKPVITVAPQVNGSGEFIVEVRGLADLNDSWDSDFIQMNQTGPSTWEVPEPKEKDEKPAPEPHFFRVVVF